LIYCHFGTNGKLIAQLRELKIIPKETRIVVRFHGLDMNPSKYDQNFYRVLAKNVSSVIVGSSFAYKALKSYGFEESKISIIPVGVKDQYLQGEITSNKINGVVKIVSIGRLIELKGHAISITAMAKLKASFENFKFTIIGSGPLKEKLTQQTINLGLSEHVEIIDKLTHSEVFDFLKNSHVYVYSGIKDASGREEGQGLANLEAMAVGIPIVASKIGGVSDYVLDNHTGFLCGEGDSNCFAQKVKYVIDNIGDETIIKIRNSAVEWVKLKYSQKISNLKILELIKD
jgi:colanic acid/amylovoran biosynthesis glycosyltransferase